MENNKTALKQLNTMVILTIITQCFILIKNALVASTFGVSAELDAFNLTNTISNFVYSFIGAGIATVIIPYLKEQEHKKAVDTFISTLYTLSFILLIVLIIFREQLIYITSGSSNIYFVSMASKIFIFTIIAGFLNAFIQLIKAFLEFEGLFNRQKLIILLTTILLVFLLWVGNNNIYYYATITLITTLLGLVIHLYFLKKINNKLSINFNVRSTEFKKMIRLFIPTALSAGVYQTSLLIDTMIAARLGVGSISILNYSNSIILMINMLLLANITSFVYPRLVKKRDEMEKQESLFQYILFTNAIMWIIVILFYSVGREGVSVLFERGEFNSENTKLVFICTLILTLSLPTNGVRDLMYRYFFINQDTLTPFLNSLIISVINIVISLILANYIGLFGVVVGTVVASYLSLFFITRKLKKNFLVYFNQKQVLIENFKVIIAAFITGILTLLLKNILMINSNLVSIVVYSIFIISFYIVLLKLLRSRVFKISL